MANETKATKPVREKIEGKTRTPKGPGIFDSVGRNRQDSGIHPLREIVGFPAENTLDSQTTSVEIATHDIEQMPIVPALDSQTQNIGNTELTSTVTTPEADGLPNSEILDIQTHTADLPNEQPLDSQTEISGLPNVHSLDIANENAGKPNTETLAIKLAESEKPEIDRASHIANTKSLASQKPVEAGKWNKYDKARSTETVFVRAVPI